jgi:transposase-like protein
LQPRKRSEQALVAVVQEAYVNGVSTRKVDRLVEQMGVHMSKDQVSRLCRGLDEHVQAFRERPLEGRYPYLWLDGKIERVRERGGVRQKCLVIAYAVHETGRREVIGLDVGEAETEAFWRAFLRSLRARGLHGVRLCVSDCHQGLKNAIGQVLGTPWQRCTVHFLRNMLGHCAKRQQPMISAATRGIFAADDGQQAREHWTKLRSTNPLERVHREIGRRSDVIGILLSQEPLSAVLWPKTTTPPQIRSRRSRPSNRRF